VVVTNNGARALLLQQPRPLPRPIAYQYLLNDNVGETVFARTARAPLMLFSYRTALLRCARVSGTAASSTAHAAKHAHITSRPSSGILHFAGGRR